MPSEPSRSSWVKKAPQIVCLLIFLTMVGLLIFDFNGVKAAYMGIIDWVEQNPYSAIIVVILLYTVEVVSLAPTIAYTHLFIGFTYAKVFDSVWKGYFFAVPVVWAGCMSGAFFSF